MRRDGCVPHSVRAQQVGMRLGNVNASEQVEGPNGPGRNIGAACTLPYSRPYKLNIFPPAATDERSQSGLSLRGYFQHICQAGLKWGALLPKWKNFAKKS